jgi:hypothetical protein
VYSTTKYDGTLAKWLEQTTDVVELLKGEKKNDKIFSGVRRRRR